MPTAEEFFGISRPDLESELTDFYDEAEKALLKANPQLAGELKFRSTLPMDQLPFDVRTELIRKYRNIIGFDEALTSLGGKNKPIVPAVRDAKGIYDTLKQGVSDIYGELRTDIPAGAKNPYGRLPGETSGSLLSNIYSRINVQFKSNLYMDRAGLKTKLRHGTTAVQDVITGTAATDANIATGATASSHFVMGLNSIPTKHSMSAPIYTPGMLANKSRMVYDVETAGFAKGSIREVAYSITSATGIPTTPDPLLFTPAQFNRGIVNVEGQPGTLTDFLRSKFKIKPPALTGGDEFAEGMEPFLKEVLQNDYIVGHNISNFDNEQVFVGLSRTKKYKKDKVFQKLVDDAFEKVKTSSLDTLSLVKQMPNLAEIKTAKELTQQGSRELFSITNLLIQTDLVDHLDITTDAGVRLTGMDALTDLVGYDPNATDEAARFSRGLHHAAVDTAMTNAMLDAADKGGLKLNGPLSGDDLTGAAAEIRRAAVESSAITPFTNLKSVDELEDDVLRKMVNSYKDAGKGRKYRKSPLQVQKGSELDELLLNDPDQAYTALREKKLKPDSIKLTALEQQILMERDIAGGMDDVAISSGDTLRRMRVMRPEDRVAESAEEALRFNAEAQAAGREAGIGLAGLSTEERSLAYRLSEATSGLNVLGVQEKRAAALVPDLLVSRFNLFDPSEVQYATRSGRPSMPIQLLEKAGVFNEDEMLTLSMLSESTSSEKKAVNVVKEFRKGETAQLRTFLTDLMAGPDEDIAEALGMKADEAETAVVNLRTAMEKPEFLDELDKRGVSVAQIYEGDDGGVVRDIGNIFRDITQREGQLHDEDISNWKIPFMTRDKDVLRTGGAVYVGAGGIAEAEGEALQRGLRGTLVGYGQALNMDRAELIQAKMRAVGGAPAESISKAYRAASEIIPHLGKGILGIAAATTVAVLFNKHQENEELDETLDFQGYESNAEGQYGAFQQVQQRMESGYEGYSNLMDPLATASITNNLNNNRVGHDDMSWDRNNSIYGGAL